MIRLTTSQINGTSPSTIPPIPRYLPGEPGWDGMMMATEVKTNLRLPEDLYEKVKRWADKDLRSINAEIQVLLREAIEAREKKSK